MTKPSTRGLFSPLSITSSIRAKNRLFLAPMTTTQSPEHGLLGTDDLAWLARCSEGGFGSIITPAAAISATSLGFDGQLSVAEERHIPALRQLAHTLTLNGCVSLLQICHPGMRAPARLNGGAPFAPSAVKLDFPGFEIPRALSLTEIEQIIADFANASLRAYKAGFNGVEIHGANGYLITQFLHAQNNFRNDQYGGSLENRARFARQVVQACRAMVPGDFVIGFRLSPEGNGLDIDENLQIARWLQQDGIDYLHLSSLDAGKNADKYPETGKKVTTLFREVLGADFPLLATGGIQQMSDAQQVLEQGADMAGLGRIALGNPDWPARAQQDPAYQPVLPPYSETHLKQQGISAEFIHYIRTLPLNIIQPS
jgi:2,4-dienoyl-CoA reductase-like NADH-dependent reductase (Old Yellow Enzyme family)